MTRVVRVLIAAAAIALFAQPCLSQDKIELKATTFLPPTHWWVTKVLNPWAQEMAKRTNGKVDVRVFAANSPFGNVANQADQVMAGVTDATWAMNSLPPGRNPRSLIMEIPLIAPTSKAATKTLWSMRDTYLAPDYKGFKVLALHCLNGVGFATRDKKVEKLEDLAGLRVRTPNKQVEAILLKMGATPVRMGAAQFYESLERGILDGVTTGYEGLHAFRLENIIKYYYDARISVICFSGLMKQARFDALPPDVRAAIDATTGDAWQNVISGFWDESDDNARVTAKKAGVTETVVSNATRAQWRKELTPIIDGLLADAVKSGVANAREIYAEMLKRADKFDSQ